MTIRWNLPLLFGLICQSLVCAGTHPPAAGEQVAIITTSGIPAYDEVLDGLRKGLGRQPAYVIDLRQKNGDHVLAESLRLGTIKVVVTIGSEAAETVVGQHPTAPVIAAATMAQLFSKDAARGRPVSVLPVQSTLPAVLEAVRRVFPGKLRLGMLRNPTLSDLGADALKTAAEAAGFSPRIVDCPGPGKLLESFQSLKDQSDFVLCFPDAALYNSATVKPLVLASLHHRLPLIGFSESFVRAGAVLAVYPDFRDLGARAADLAQKLLNGQSVVRMEYSRRSRVAINQNITRLLGVSYKQPSGASDDFIVIR
jgi:putative ABC transport system substrate-binding protein